MDTTSELAVERFVKQVRDAPRKVYNYIDLINEACKFVETENNYSETSIYGSAKQHAAITLIENALPLLVRRGLIGDDVRRVIAEQLLPNVDAIKEIINSLVAIWNSIETQTGSCLKRYLCCCCR